MFYRTRLYADDGRNWFEAIVEDAVEFRIRDIQDPGGGLRHLADDAPPAPGIADVPPELATPAIRQALMRIYANWADEPLLALHERSPREAIATPAGLERVRGLLRSYQPDENRQARTSEAMRAESPISAASQLSGVCPNWSRRVTYTILKYTCLPVSRA